MNQHPIKRIISISVILVSCFPALKAYSQEPTFKRVIVEERPIGSKINIQIDPEEQARALAPPENPLDTTLLEDRIKPAEDNIVAAPLSRDTEWFWSNISPSISAAAFDRISDASRQMTNAPAEFYLPKLQTLQNLSQKFGKEILLASLDQNVSPAFILAVIAVESSGKSDALSEKGAQGLMQLIPATAERFGVADSNDPAQNIAGGTKYLSWLLSEFKGDPLLALAGYNSGENAVKKYQGVPPFPETRNYIPKVIAAWKVARNLCTSPPVLVSEACIFRAQSIN